MKLARLMGLVVLAVMLTATSAVAWTSYNDFGGFDGNDANVTQYVKHEGTCTPSGYLKDIDSGADTAYCMTEMVGPSTLDDIWLNVDGVTNADSDAYTIFASYMNTAGGVANWVVMSSTEKVAIRRLDPDMTYTFVLLLNAHAGGGTPLYGTISDADSWTNTSSAGATKYGTGEESTYIPADNRTNGYVIRWENITPGPDGDFVVTFGSYSGASYWSGSGFMVEAFSEPEPPPVPNQAEFYVSPSGSDTNPGTETAPFATIERARNAVRKINANMTGDIIVYLREGVYRLSSTLALEDIDSGTNGYDVVYQAYPAENVSISGGQLITGWSMYNGDIYKAVVTGTFRQLFVDGIWCVRARTPNGGPDGNPSEASYNRVAAWVPGANRVLFNAGELDEWSGLTQVEHVSLLDWGLLRFRVASVNLGQNAMTPQKREGANRWELDYPLILAGDPYYFENSIDFLGSPAEWYLDTRTGTLYCIPPTGVDLSTAEVVAPSLERLIDIDRAQNIRFCDLVLEHTTWHRPSNEGFVGWQGPVFKTATGHKYHGMVMMPAAVQLEYARDCSFENCTFRFMGGTGLRFKAGTDGNVVDRCHFEDIAASAVAFGDVWFDEGTYDPGRADDPGLIPRNDRVTNCTITHVGKDYPGCPGIFATWCEGAVIEHNEVSYIPYTGISVGWGWGSAYNPNPTSLKHNMIRFNEIHHILQLLSDGGGIYMLGYQTESEVAENYIHDMYFSSWARTRHGGCIYLDQGSGGNTLIQDNVAENYDSLQWTNGVEGPILGNWWATDPDIIAGVKANAGPTD